MILMNGFGGFKYLLTLIHTRAMVSARTSSNPLIAIKVDGPRALDLIHQKMNKINSTYFALQNALSLV